jgi:hypothetical protein
MTIFHSSQINDSIPQNSLDMNQQENPNEEVLTTESRVEILSGGVGVGG